MKQKNHSPSKNQTNHSQDNMNKNKLIPKLRFPEFQNTEGWEVKTLGEIAYVYQPKTISQTDLKNTGYPVYGANGIIGYYDQYNHETEQIAIACRGSSCGTVNYTSRKSWITGNAMVVNIDNYNDVIDKKFIFYQLSFANLTYLITGSGQPQITSNIKIHKISLPTLPEQQKIADCLLSLDEVITAESEKLELLKQHKKGLLQNLFPQAGETVPKFRFKEFEDSGEWEEKTIENILYAENSTLALNKLDLKQNGYAVYGADSIIGYIDTFQHNHPYISIVKDGSGVGRLNLCEGNTSILGTLSALKSKDEQKYLFEWAYYLLNTIDFSSYVKGSGIPHIYYSDYKSQNIGVPQPAEQQKIAACLSSLDDLIAAQAEKIELLKQHKKGLLQGLFPENV